MAGKKTAPPNPPGFLLVTCQVGAERALKAEVARRWPAFHFAYSRGGFVTFKLPAGHKLADDFDLDCVFARAWGFSLGKVTGDLDACARGVWQVAGDSRFDALHVWQRDTARPGWRGFEPQVTPAAREAEATIRRHAPVPYLPSAATPGSRVLDCVIVEPNEWWIGWHRARAGESCFAGGMRDISLPPQAVSRAWLKMEEALAWSELPIAAGQKIAELGCAPGGSCQALLAHGLAVLGIDPAKVDPRVLADRNFTHVQKRGDDVRRRDFQGVAWLAADMNVAPDTTLDTVEAIVTHPTVNVRGLLLTLKLLEWNMAEEIPRYLERIRGWGFKSVRARQLVHNRQEICVTALRATKRSRRTTTKRRVRPKSAAAKRRIR